MKNACVVGYGAVGPIHASAIKASKYANLYAVCDNEHNKLELAKKDYDCMLFSDFNEVLNDKNIDTVHICTPHYLHKDMTISALKAGKDVVLEKPCAMTADEFEELYSYKTDRKICVMLQNRTNICIGLLKDIVDNDKTVGNMLGISAFLTWHRTPEYYMADEWRGKWKTEGGGLLINQAIHTIDLINYLGSGVKSVKASVSTKKLNDVIEVEDTADALFEMNNGVTGLFYGTNAFSSWSPAEIEIKFENATFRYADERLYKITDKETVVIGDDANMAEGKRYWGSGHLHEIDDFYKNLCGEESEYITLENAAHTMRVLFAMYESAKNNSKKVEL